MWMLAFMTGMRRGERLELSWDELRMDDDRLVVLIEWQAQHLTKREVADLPKGVECAPLGNGMCRARPKTEKGRRVIPLPDTLAGRLLTYVKEHGVNRDGLVFHTDDGEPLTPRVERTRWKKALHRVGLSHDYVPHSARHTTATILNRLGLDDVTRTAIIGNSRVSTTNEIYTHVELDRLAAATDGGIDMLDVKELLESRESELTELHSDGTYGAGDFRSKECLELLDKADIVVTHPPFSLFREYVATLMEHDRKFVIVSNVNAVTYKEIFPLLREGRMWPGSSFNKAMEFSMPEEYKSKTGKCNEHRRKIGKVPAVAWYTNLDIKKRHEDIPLFRHYQGHEADYPKYDNYDVTEVSRVADIPEDYDGVMGVTITFIPTSSRSSDWTDIRSQRRTLLADSSPSTASRATPAPSFVAVRPSDLPTVPHLIWLFRAKAPLKNPIRYEILVLVLSGLLFRL
ncbi:adenine-specific methyltransferase EcoRI family protein [Bifidobacterium dentium]|uniref:adenine-specific methyltransferase EcoRI family protein n=1 Tax=Bifidobacterium dentium TaxID=1689 RepID=UPI0022DE9863|nr:adenine-specific methyltransferase EcoRI family protein [Bifidobacterium dentium]